MGINWHFKDTLVHLHRDPLLMGQELSIWINFDREIILCICPQNVEQASYTN